MTTSNQEGDMALVLSPWVGKRAGLLFNSFVAMTSYAELAGGNKDPPTNEEHKMTVADYTIVTAFIMSAKDCLTQEVKTQLTNAAYGWSARLFTKQECRELVERGANMTQEQCDKYIATERKLAGEKGFDKTALFVYIYIFYL